MAISAHETVSQEKDYSRLIEFMSRPADYAGRQSTIAEYFIKSVSHDFRVDHNGVIGTFYPRKGGSIIWDETMKQVMTDLLYPEVSDEELKQLAEIDLWAFARLVALKIGIPNDFHEYDLEMAKNTILGSDEPFRLRNWDTIYPQAGGSIVDRRLLEGAGSDLRVILLAYSLEYMFRLFGGDRDAGLYAKILSDHMDFFEPSRSEMKASVELIRGWMSNADSMLAGIIRDPNSFQMFGGADELDVNALGGVEAVASCLRTAITRDTKGANRGAEYFAEIESEMGGDLSLHVLPLDERRQLILDLIRQNPGLPPECLMAYVSPSDVEQVLEEVIEARLDDSLETPKRYNDYSLAHAAKLFGLDAKPYILWMMDDKY
jgi:hypothetical protein